MTAKIKKRSPYSGYKHPHKPRGVNKHAFNKVYWPYLPLILAISTLLALSVRGEAFKHPPDKVLSVAHAMDINKLLADTNSKRSQNGLNPLSLNVELDQAAQAKAVDMVTRDYWSHNTPDGNPPWQFVENVNYSYQKLGENLATGFSDEQSSIDGWMASPPHRHNLLDPAYTEVGFGVSASADYKAAGGGPMTVVVAFYGNPAAAGFSRVLGVSTESGRATHAQLALADTSLSSKATIGVIFIGLSAAFIWLSRHVLAIRRVVTKSEAYIIRHPLTDIGLIIVIALAFILSRTAGFIK